MENKDINISIIIVNYNSVDYLEQCISSIRTAGRDLPYEVIIVDNNSSDLPDFDFLNKYDNVKLIKLNENLGFAKANNIGVNNSVGKYVLILNPDTLLAENTLKVMRDYMENNEEVGVSGCKVLNSDGSFQLACRRGFPTPWVSFTRLFGLQKLFPKSRIFARYNQTYRPVDETYYIDSVIGAFMMIRRSVWDAVAGFDETYFMYGEDIDLCYRISKYGWKIAYVHSTTIVHFKGVSTKRSAIDELDHFYSAMSIFSRKHFSNSSVFLFFLKTGILFRKQLAKLQSNLAGFLIFIFDIFSVNFALALATRIRFRDYFNFPDYAYPTVFIVLSLIIISSMIAVGEYLERKHSVSKAIEALLISFFVLSSLTYFFKDYAFSRGVVLMTIAFSFILMSFSRFIVEIYDKLKGKKSMSRIAIVGTNANAVNLFNSIRNITSINSEIVGFVSGNKSNENLTVPAPIIGNIEYLKNIVIEKQINEIVVADDKVSPNIIFSIIEGIEQKNISIRFVKEFNDYIASGIVNEINGKYIDKYQLNLSKLKYRILKRSFDIFISIIFLSIGLPFVFLFTNKPKSTILNLWNVLIGKVTIVGLYEGYEQSWFCLPGIISLAKIGNTDLLTKEIITKLNNYYLKNYSITLDMEIIFKYLIRKKRGN